MGSVLGKIHLVRSSARILDEHVVPEETPTGLIHALR